MNEETEQTIYHVTSFPIEPSCFGEEKHVAYARGDPDVIKEHYATSAYWTVRLTAITVTDVTSGLVSETKVKRAKVAALTEEIGKLESALDEMESC